MGCAEAPACRAALREASARWPRRSTASDGICGDSAHKARKSDHNLGNAFDLTHDPAAGVDCNTIAAQLVHDSRVKYLIWNRRIWNPAVSRTWRTYTGPNPHTKHLHVSIHAHARNDIRPWFGPRALPPEKEDDMYTPSDRLVAQQTLDMAVAAASESGWANGYGGTAHVWHVDAAGMLLHRWYDITSSKWRVEQIGASCDISSEPQVVQVLGQLHVFVRGGDKTSIVHAFWNGQKWATETLQ